MAAPAGEAAVETQTGADGTFSVGVPVAPNTKTSLSARALDADPDTMGPVPGGG